MPSITEEDQQPDGGAAPLEQQQQAAQPPQNSSCGQLQARREAWRTVRHLRQQKGLTHHLLPLVPDDAMEVDALCEEAVSQPDMEAFFDKAGEFTTPSPTRFSDLRFHSNTPNSSTCTSSALIPAIVASRSKISPV